MSDLVKAKLKQAQSLLTEFGIPLWIAQFARETGEHPEPVQTLVVGTSVTWPAAFIITPESSVAVVGTGDVAGITDAGAYDEVIGYVQDVGPPLRACLERFDPSSIAVSWSRDDESSDNLTYGMYLMLREVLGDTPYADRLRTAEEVTMALRARKLPEEVDLIRQAIAVTDELFDEIEHALSPGITERELQAKVHGSIRRRGLTAAWDVGHDPVINFGPDSKFGHAGPGDIRLATGMLVHVDLGVKVSGYCSDLQRMWYAARSSDEDPPAEISAAFETVLTSLRAGFSAMRPGIPGWQVDAAAREVLIAAGCEEPQFAFGHQLGQSAHDGGALLGPRWPRYGRRPELLLEEGHVYTLEFGVPTSAGPMGLEEDVIVTSDGASYLSIPQTELRVVRF